VDPASTRSSRRSAPSATSMTGRWVAIHGCGDGSHSRDRWWSTCSDTAPSAS
jgi:hypothetical protein